LVLDADALQPDLVGRGDAPRILTPHAGEFARLELDEDDPPAGCTLVHKGPITRIKHANVTYHSIEGGPGLARGGSGDLLAGLIGGRLAGCPERPLEAALQATFWHGRAARRLAEDQGEVAVRNSALVDWLNPVLREEAAE
jgi:NAD(P)H-hydrate epimerase